MKAQQSSTEWAGPGFTDNGTATRSHLGFHLVCGPYLWFEGGPFLLRFGLVDASCPVLFFLNKDPVGTMCLQMQEGYDNTTLVIHMRLTSQTAY